MIDEFPIIFANKQSKKLFDCNLSNGENEENFEKLNQRYFKQISR